ncbi:hydantoinase B/oxoprolinase family protein [Paracoccus sp. APAP_BH8]|uniref:hydantoinase B/oxoprolinase family protein n=1 Tax=Paracoccus sp. APAP_BH8 TaxID=3110237 RepID=UPI002FD7DB6C
MAGRQRGAQIIERNVRLPDLVIGDLEAQLATCALGERELLRIPRARAAAG